MRVLFAVSNEKMSETIVNQYQKEFKEKNNYNDNYAYRIMDIRVLFICYI